MSSNTSPIRVVQCPKCGSPVQGVSAGDIATCSYCGATLQVSAGVSGHPIAKLAATQASAAYLARSAELKRLREQLQGLDGEQWLKQQMLESKVQEVEALEGKRRDASSSAVWSIVIILSSLIYLFIDREAAYCMIPCIICLLIALYFWERAGSFKEARDHAMNQAEGIKEDIDSTMPERDRERDRLAQRIAQLKAGLDDLADQL